LTGKKRLCYKEINIFCKLKKEYSMQKKYFLSCALLALTAMHAHADDRLESGDTVGRSYFRLPTNFQTGTPIRESLFRLDRAVDHGDGCGGAFQVVPFGGESTAEDRLARYFLPNGKTSMLVAEDGAPQADQRDVDARHLNIETEQDNFQSRVRICPEVSYAGVGLDWTQILCRGDNGEPRLWFELAAPIQWVKVDMNLRENTFGEEFEAVDEIGLNDQDRVASAAAGLRSDGLSRSRIDNVERDDVKLADVELKLGYSSKWGDSCHVATYLGVLFPTSDAYNDIDDNNKCATARQLLQPVSGEGDHWGFMYGSHYGIDIGEYCSGHVGLRFDVHGLYLFENDELRTFSLKDKTWSRYMEFYRDQEQAQEAFDAVDASAENLGVSGVNVLTQCAQVTPGYKHNGNFAMVYERCNFVGEVGLGMHCAQAEKVDLCRLRNKGFALKDVQGNGRTNAARTIKDQFTNSGQQLANYEDNIVQLSDIDLNSAAQATEIEHTFYGALGYEWGDCRYPTVVGLGGSYTLGATNNTLDRWMVWGKLGVSF
jgi:hypothetical protein